MSGLRIGELADLAGVSTRAVRLYEQRGLLPEPARTASGYRTYEVADAVRLLRVRRLAELGLSLDDIAAVLAHDDETDVRDALRRLDAELGAQQQALSRRRRQIQSLLAQEGDLAASDELRGVVERLGRLPLRDDLDQRALARETRLLHSVDALAPDATAHAARLYETLADDSALVDEAMALARGLEELADPEATIDDMHDLVQRAAAFRQRVPLPTAGEPGPAPVPAEKVDELLLASATADMRPLQREFISRLVQVSTTETPVRR